MTNNCTNKTHDSHVKVAGEHGRQAVIRNGNRESFIRSKVDGCMLKQQTAADWVVSKPKVGDVIIELKGGDVSHAVDQIQATLNYWNKNNLSNGKFGALVVCSKYPKVDTKIQRAKLFLASKHKTPLHVVTQNLEYDFDALLSIRGPFST